MSKIKRYLVDSTPGVYRVVVMDSYELYKIEKILSNINSIRLWHQLPHKSLA